MFGLRIVRTRRLRELEKRELEKREQESRFAMKTDLQREAGRWVFYEHQRDPYMCKVLDAKHALDPRWPEAKEQAARQLEHLRPPRASRRFTNPRRDPMHHDVSPYGPGQLLGPASGHTFDVGEIRSRSEKIKEEMAPQRTRELPEALESLGKYVDSLSAYLDDLAERLGPVLQPEPPQQASDQKTAGVGPGGPNSGYAYAVHVQAQKIGRMIGRVSSLVSRLEV